MSIRNGKENSRKYNQSMNTDEFPNHSWRLTFLYDKGYMKMSSARHLEIIAPPSDKLGKLDPCTGFCCELRTVRGRVLYRRFGADPIKNNIEVYGGNSDDKFTKVDIEKPRVEFDILIPHIENASKIVLLGDASGNTSALMESILELDLGDLPTQKKY